MPRTLVSILLGAAAIVTPVVPIVAQQAPSRILFTNVNVWDGTSESLRTGMSVLVEGNLIAQVARSIRAPSDATVIDGGGRTLMPGLIDSHVHWNVFSPVANTRELEGTHWEEIGAYAVLAAQDWLQRGFTTVRDMCGMHSGVRKLIDRGDIAGPRLYLAGGCIGQTSGHGDWRFYSQEHASETNLVKLGILRVVDGRAEVLKAARQNLSLGADYFKLMVGGGVTSDKDPLHSMQLTPDEIRAAVEVAEMWDTYVGVHVYHDAHINRAIDLGVRVIDHGQFASRETVQRMKDEGIIFSLNLSGMDPQALEHPVYGNPANPAYAKIIEFMELSSDLFAHIKAVQPDIVFGSDFVLVGIQGARIGMDHEIGFWAQSLGNYMTLKALTSTGGKLASYTGQNNPYPGKLGVIEEGAYADILLVDGNPLEDISVIGGTMKWFDAEPRGPSIETIRLIMKDGNIYKNTLDGR